jgi:hypothetical protein
MSGACSKNEGEEEHVQVNSGKDTWKTKMKVGGKY